MTDIPEFLKVEWIKKETQDTLTFALASSDKQRAFLAGQFSMLYAFGYGESAISLSGDPENVDQLIYTVKAVGNVTEALFRIMPGDRIGVRGPYGTHWPLDKKGFDLVIIAGGVGIATLRSLLYAIRSRRASFGKVTLLYGAKTAESLLYKDEWPLWKESNMDVVISLDHKDLHWKGKTGVITDHIKDAIILKDQTAVYCCGPDAMLHAACKQMEQLGVTPNHIYLSLERNMQCAQRLCGRCQLGPYFLCKEGPVVCFQEVKQHLAIKEL